MPDNLPADDRTQASDGARPGALAERHRVRVHERIEGLQALGAGTDGFAVVNTNDLVEGIGRIIDDTSAYYLLGYYSSNPEPDGQYRTIRVNVRQPGLDVRARRGYRAARTAVEPEGAAGTGAEPMAELREAAFGRLARVRRDTALSMRATAGAGVATVVVELAPARAAAAGEGTAVLVELVGADGAVVASGEAAIRPGTRGALVRLPLPGGLAGPLRANAVIGTGRNRLQDSIAVLGDAGRLVGDAVVFRATPSPRSPLVPAADYQFRRTERVHVEWTRFATLDHREARLLGRNGEPLPVPVALTERELEGRVVVAADVNLAPLTDGEYAIELTVGQGTTSETRVVAIRVSR